MCCLRVLGPWSPLSDVSPRVFPALTVHWQHGTQGQPPDMSNDSSVEQKLVSPRQFVLLLSPHSTAQAAPGSLGLCHTKCLSHLPPIIWGEVWVHLLLCLCFLCGDSDRFESPDILEPDCWAKTNWCPVAQMLRDTDVNWRNCTFWRGQQVWADPCNWTLETEFREWMPGSGCSLYLLVVLRSSTHHTLSVQAWEHLFCLRTKLI